MENPGLLNWRGWSSARWGENFYAAMFGGLWLVTMIPTCLIYHGLGWVWKGSSAFQITPVFWAMVTTNSFLLAVLGSALGSLVGFIKKRFGQEKGSHV